MKHPNTAPRYTLLVLALASLGLAGCAAQSGSSESPVTPGTPNTPITPITPPVSTAVYPLFNKADAQNVGSSFVLAADPQNPKERVKPMETSDNMGLMGYDEAQTLMDLVSDDNGRVLVADKDLYATNPQGQDMTLYIPYTVATADQFKDNPSKVSLNYIYPGVGTTFRPDPSTPVSHGVSVVAALIANTDYNLPEYQPKMEGNPPRLKTPFHPGYLGKKGYVHVITAQKHLSYGQINEGSMVFSSTIEHTAKSVSHFIPWMNENFKILNISFGSTLKFPKENDEDPTSNGVLSDYNFWQYNATIFTYKGDPNTNPPTEAFKKALWDHPEQPTYTRMINALAPVAKYVDHANTPLQTLNILAKKGMFITKSYDEDNNATVEEMSILYGVDHLNKKPFFDDAWKAMVFVTAYDWQHYNTPNYQTTQMGNPDADDAHKGFYANICGAGAPICLVSFDWSFVPLSDGSWWGYEPSKNAFRNPFVAAGTSLAAPRVAGVAALVRSVFPFASNFNLQSILLSTSAYIDPTNYTFAERPADKPYNAVTGWGLVQPGQAIYGPKLFYSRDFVADFNTNAGYMDHVAEGTRYTFANDISGQYGLTVIGNEHSKPVLVLLGNNTYQGATTLQQNAHLVVNGVLNNSAVTVDATSTLAGNGQVASVVNNGTVQAEDQLHAQNTYQADVAIADAKQPKSRDVPLYSTEGLYIQGDYTQSSAAHLQARLGMPLGVGGTATLSGNLDIAGVASALIADHNATGTVLVAKHVSGQFNSVSSLSPLIQPVDGSAKVQDFQVDGKPFQAVTVQVHYQPAATTLSRAAAPLRVGASNLDRLHQAAAHSASSVNKGLYQQLLSIQNGTRESLMSAAHHLSGDEFTQSLRHSYRMSQFMLGSNQLTVLNTPNHNGISLGAKAGGIFGLGDDSLLANYESLFMNFGTGRVRARLGVDLANLSYKVNKEASSRDNKSELRGTTLFMTEPLGGFDVHFQLGFYRYQNTLTRQGLGGSADTVVSTFKEHDILFAANASYPFTLNDTQSITPFVGAGANISHLDGFKEAHSTYTLAVPKQNLQQNWLQLGAAWQVQNVGLQGFSVQLGYQGTLPLSSSKQFNGALITGGTPAAYTFNTPYDKVLQQIALDAAYHGEQLDLSTQVQATYLQDWALSIGARVEWKF